MGQILECPKCRSMVQIAPPPGWQPAAAAAEAAAPGPPPLDRVATDPAMLDLDLTGGSWFSTIVGGNAWLLGGATLTLVVLIVAVLGWRWTPAARPAAVAVDALPPAAKKTADDRAMPSLSQSENVGAPRSPAAPAVAPPADPPEARPAKADLPPLAEDAAKNASKGEREEAKPAKQAEVKKLPPATEDVDARMTDALPGIELTNVPLLRAIEVLSNLSSLPITLDTDAMRQLGIRPRDPISLQLDGTTIGGALQAAAARRGLAVTVDNGQVILSLPAEQRETLRTVPYTISDLTGNDKAAVAELAAVIRRLVAPESWQGTRGRGMIELHGGALKVTQTREVHWQVLVFCEKLRNARNKPLRSHDQPELFTLATRTSQARALLDRPVTVNFHEPTPLGKILDFLAKATDSDILIDHAGLAAAETLDGVETSLTVEGRPLAAVLDELLRPLGLAYRAVGANVLQVSSAEAVAERLELEFYPLGSRLDGAEAAAKLIERLKAAAPTTWAEKGGAGEVYVDPPSRCLIVLQSQPIQAAIEQLLKKR